MLLLMTWRNNAKRGKRMGLNPVVPLCVRKAKQQQQCSFGCYQPIEVVFQQQNLRKLRLFKTFFNLSLLLFSIHSFIFLFLLLPVSLSDQSKAMLTELCLASDEFDHFAVQAHNSVTFCLKELRVRQRIKEGLMEQQIRKISQVGEDQEIYQRKKGH